MLNILHNRILTKYIIAIFVAFIFLMPFSISVTEILNVQTPLTMHIAYAQEKVSVLKFLDDPGLFLGNLILNIASSFTWLGGSLFDSVFSHVVFGMGSQMSGPLGSAVDVTWKIIRDICNLAFIFGFIYIGIRTILDSDSSSTKTLLARVIIAALLINFSLFFAKVIIDFSNFTSVQIYNTLTAGGGSISASVANSLGIVSFYKTPDPATLAQITSGGKVWFFFMAAMFLFITAFVFFAAAILLIVRFVALILIMVFSPLLFAATVFPGTQGIASDLWKKLISYSFFAPAYLLLVLVSLTLIKGLSLVKGSDGFASLSKTGSITASGDALSVVLQFFIVIFFMIAALMIAQKMGIQGGQMAINVGNNIRGRVQGAMGRTFVGRPAAALLEKYDNESARSKNMKGARGSINRGMQKILDVTGGDRAIRNTFEAGKKATFGSDYSLKDEKEYYKGRKADRASINELDTLQISIAKSQLPGATPDDLVKMERAVSSASNDQVLKLVKDELKEDSPEYKAVVANMTPSQFDGLMKLKQDELDDAKKSKLGASRASAVQNRLIANVTGANSIEDVIGKADGKDLDALSYDTVYENAPLLTTKQIDDMSKLTTTSKSRLKEKRKQDLLSQFALPGGPQAIFTHFKESEIAKLPDGILTSPKAVPFLSSNVLSKILDNDGITPIHRATIRNNITAQGSNALNVFFNTPRGNQF